MRVDQLARDALTVVADGTWLSTTQRSTLSDAIMVPHNSARGSIIAREMVIRRNRKVLNRPRIEHIFSALVLPLNAVIRIQTSFARRYRVRVSIVVDSSKRQPGDRVSARR